PDSAAANQHVQLHRPADTVGGAPQVGSRVHARRSECQGQDGRLDHCLHGGLHGAGAAVRLAGRPHVALGAGWHRRPALEPRSRRDYRVLWQTPSSVLDTLGMLAMTFVLGGVGAFMPTYVYEREARFALTPAALDRFEEKANPPAELLTRLRPLADEAEQTK